MKPIITFKKYKILEYNFKRLENDSNTNEERIKSKPEFELEVQPAITPDFKFGKIVVDVAYNSNEFKINLKVEGYFEVSDNLEKNEVEEVLTLNGTSILFPYVRSMVSMLTSLDSTQAIILPTINTYNLLKGKEKKSTGDEDL